MQIAITGADGFIGTNLRVRLTELGHADVVSITRSTSVAALPGLLAKADFVFHLAGVNRSLDDSDFVVGNVGLTQRVCDALAAAGRSAAVLFASSTQAALENAYGRSKRDAEQVVRAYGRAAAATVYVARLTNVFGKWARPHYNSAVATFCHNIARDLPIRVNDATAPLQLLYVDDLMSAMVELLDHLPQPSEFFDVRPVYQTTVGNVADIVRGFAKSRDTLLTASVGAGLVRALYSTYMSHLPTEKFVYSLPRHADARGEFVEMLKTPDCGQFSYFTAHPGITRGEHYHHSKTEKFLVIQGTARFEFRHILTGDVHELVTQGRDAQVVETIPGWVHNITNVGDDELIVMLWANEVFDRQKPDTFAMKVKP